MNAAIRLVNGLQSRDHVTQAAFELHKFTGYPSARQHSSYGDCLEVKREYYQNCRVLDCVAQCSQSVADLCEQFLKVQQIGFLTLGPLRCAWRRLPRVVLL